MATVEIKTTPERLKTLVVGSKVFRSSFDYKLTHEDLERARKELGETDEVRAASLQKLKEKLSHEKTKYRTDDAYLLRFLRCKKFKCKEAFEMVRSFYSLRKEYTRAFSKLPSESILKNHMNNEITYMPYRDEDGSLLLVQKFGNWNPKELTVYDLFNLFQPVGDVISMNPCVQIHKIKALFDFEGVGWNYASAIFHPKFLLFWLKAWQNLYPWRIKCVLLVNLNQYAYGAFKSIRHLLKKKIADRVIIIGSDITEIHQHINPAILPKKYGGSLEDSEWRSTIQHTIDNLRYVEYEHSFFNA